MVGVQDLKILVIEDDPLLGSNYLKYLDKWGDIQWVQNSIHANRALDTQIYDIVLIDIHLEKEAAGLSLIPKAKKMGAHIIMLSNEECDQIVKEAYKKGCHHFLVKENIFEHLDNYLNHYVQNLKHNLDTNFFQNRFITNNKKLKAKISQLIKINLKNQNILITGETGVGKTLLAKLIHQFNTPKEEFVHINCSEIPVDLIESELFGHRKGSFTGAVSDKIGKLELANNGTLFLDEIATMPMAMQQKLLKAIDEKYFYPIGAQKPIHSSFTLISATCDSLEEKISLKEFRKDFYYRISGHLIELTPLRNRPEDLDSLIVNYIKKLPRKFFIEQEVIEYMKHYSWPGNTRELFKILHTFSQNINGIITLEDFKRYIQLQPIKEENLNTMSLSKTQLEFIFEHGLREFNKKIESQLVQDLYHQQNLNITQCMKKLKVSASSMYRMINKS